jgi:drug/metabolite transporter (DMT)-like permease
MPYLGEICALLTAVCWTASSTAFAIASRAVGPLPANHFRIWAALPVLFVLAWLVTGAWWPVGASSAQLGWMIASGFAGLVIGDIGYFYALAKIGPRLCSVVMACWPACVVAIEAALGRLPGPTVLVGIAATMVGVALVLLRNRDGGLWNPGVSPRQRALGFAGAVLGAVGQASGFVLAGFGMAADGTAPAVDPLACTVVRMSTAAIGIQVLATAHRQPRALLRVGAHPRALRAALVGALFGPIGGVWLSMIARERAAASDSVGIASALMATTPIFMMPVAFALYRAPIGWIGAAGTVLAVGGVAICLVGR